MPRYIRRKIPLERHKCEISVTGYPRSCDSVDQTSELLDRGMCVQMSSLDIDREACHTSVLKLSASGVGLRHSVV